MHTATRTRAAVRDRPHGVSTVGPADPGRWSRRAATVPSVLLVGLVAFVVTPLAVPVLVLGDVVRGRPRAPAARLWLIGLQYLFNEAVEVILAPLTWAVALPGDRLGRRTSERLNTRLAMWSARTLARRARQLLGVEVELEPGLRPDGAFGRGKVIVFARHASLLDAALPALVLPEVLSDARSRPMRGVLMSELLWDPGFDILYQRLGSVFIDREDGPGARESIRAMAQGMAGDGVAIVFPEGRLFAPERLERRLATLRDSDPARAERLAGLEHVLPPKPRGMTEMLAGAPDADLLVVEHSGLESVPSLRDLLRTAPIRHPVRVRVRHFPRHSVPDEPEDVTRWLDERFVEMDRWISEGRGRCPRRSPVGVNGRPNR